MNIMVEVFGHGPEDVACYGVYGAARAASGASREDCSNFDYAVTVSLFDH